MAKAARPEAYLLDGMESVCITEKRVMNRLRERFPQVHSDHLLSILWNETSFPFWEGEESLPYWMDQVNAYFAANPIPADAPPAPKAPIGRPKKVDEIPAAYARRKKKTDD